jgi:hypothetical protein
VGKVHERLREAGIRLDVRDLAPAVRRECTRLARVLQGKRCRVIGAVPAADAVAVPAVALQLGLSLAEVTGSPVGVVDAHGTWPGSRVLAENSRLDTSLFATNWLVDNLALLTPRAFDTGALLLKLEAALHDEALVFQHLIVDMTGFDHIGEHLAAMELLDGVIVVARSGKTTIPELARWMRDIPDERNLGVLLVGARL